MSSHTDSKIALTRSYPLGTTDALTFREGWQEHRVQGTTVRGPGDNIFQKVEDFAGTDCYAGNHCASAASLSLAAALASAR